MIPTQLHGTLMRSFVESVPTAPDLNMKVGETDRVELAPLDQLEIMVPAPEPITQEDLIFRLEEIRHEYAMREARLPGEEVAMGDEIVVDVIGYSDGKVLPFSIVQGLRAVLEPEMFFPGFAEQLVGCQVGESHVIHIHLPADHPNPLLRERPAAFSVDLREAHVLTLPDPDEPAHLAQLGMGEDLDTVFANIGEQLAEERSDELAELAVNLVLDQLHRLSRVNVPDDWVDEELRQRWRESEGQYLIQMELPRRDQEEALKGWLESGEMRNRARRRLGISLVLRTIAEQQGLEVDRDGLEGFVDEVAAEIGTDPYELRQSLKEDAAALRSVLDKYLHLRAVEYVMEGATVHFEGMDDEGEQGVEQVSLDEESFAVVPDFDMGDDELDEPSAEDGPQSDGAGEGATLDLDDPIGPAGLSAEPEEAEASPVAEGADSPVLELSDFDMEEDSPAAGSRPEDGPSEQLVDVGEAGPTAEPTAKLELPVFDLTDEAEDD